MSCQVDMYVLTTNLFQTTLFNQFYVGILKISIYMFATSDLWLSKGCLPLGLPWLQAICGPHSNVIVSKSLNKEDINHHKSTKSTSLYRLSDRVTLVNSYDLHHRLHLRKYIIPSTEEFRTCRVYTQKMYWIFKHQTFYFKYMLSACKSHQISITIIKRQESLEII